MRITCMVALLAAGVVGLVAGPPLAAQQVPGPEPTIVAEPVAEPDTVAAPEGVPGATGDWVLVGTIVPGGNAAAVVLTVSDGMEVVYTETVGIEDDGSFGTLLWLAPADFPTGTATVEYSVVDFFGDELSYSAYALDTAEAFTEFADPPKKDGDPAPQPHRIGREPRNKTEHKQDGFGRTGHMWPSHGKFVPDDEIKRRAAEKKHQIGRWPDSKKALDTIKDKWPKLKVGPNEIDIAPGDGEVALPDGTIKKDGVTKAIVIILPDGSIKTAYPYDPKLPRGRNDGSD